ncbi:MAG: aldo/keto reductase [Candidatus Poribacteria bacterium]|nr:MAG: aldo/keto reductase [Candidatus Poribacteria bacterium]
MEFASDAVRTLGRTGWQVSKIGYGGQRVHAEVEEHAQTLLFALLYGVNLVDTAPYYAGGGSERLVGAVLRALIETQGIRRDEVVVVTKVGPVSGAAYRTALQQEEEGRPYPEMVKLQEGFWHCIHPLWIQEELERSLERLQLERVDLLLLSSPESYFLSADSAADRRQLEAVLYGRIQDAFAQMEQLVRSGRISYYGLSSRGLGTPPDSREHLSLTRCVEEARRAAERVWGSPDRHHFAVVQLPFNLLEQGAYQVPGEPGGRTVLQAAQSFELAVLAARPLNARVGDRLIRLAQYEYDPDAEEPLTTIAAVAAAEREIVLALRAWRLWDAARAGVSGRLFFNIGETMKHLFPDLQHREHWLQALEHFLAPSIVQAVQRTEGLIPQARRIEWEPLKEAYSQAVQRMVAAVSSHFNRQETELKAPFWEALVQALGGEAEGLTLSQMAIQTVASVPGVTAVLCGMKREAYAHECVRLLSRRAFRRYEKALEAVAGLELLGVASDD